MTEKPRKPLRLPSWAEVRAEMRAAGAFLPSAAGKPLSTNGIAAPASPGGITYMTDAEIDRRREHDRMKAAGFTSFTDWRLGKVRIVEAIIGADGQTIYYRFEGGEVGELRDVQA